MSNATLPEGFLTDKSATFGHERIPRPKQPRQTRKMMNHAAYRFESMDDLWHATAVAMSAAVWNGVPIFQNLFDLRRYYDLLVEHRPEVVLETGVYTGGSAMFFMDILDILGMHETPYIGIDIDTRMVYEYAFSHSHSHLWVQRDVLAHETVEAVRPYIEGKKALVVLDSVHTKEHVDEELKLYAPLITTLGSYLVVSDADHNGRPILADYGPSAGEAVDDFLQTEIGRWFLPDKELELRYGKFTVSPNAWLKRV
jgi:cephalosporin hydroxylase